MEEKREIAAQVIERFVHSHIIKMKAKKEIQMRTDLNRNNKMNHERYQITKETLNKIMQNKKKGMF